MSSSAARPTFVDGPTPGGRHHTEKWDDYPPDPADYGPADDRGAEPDETTCRTCGRLAIEHKRGRYSIYGVCP